jgi:hypothetical protein
MLSRIPVHVNGSVPLDLDRAVQSKSILIKSRSFIYNPRDPEPYRFDSNQSRACLIERLWLLHTPSRPIICIRALRKLTNQPAVLYGVSLSLGIYCAETPTLSNNSAPVQRIDHLDK